MHLGSGWASGSRALGLIRRILPAWPGAARRLEPKREQADPRRAGPALAQHRTGPRVAAGRRRLVRARRRAAAQRDRRRVHPAIRRGDQFTHLPRTLRRRRRAHAQDSRAHQPPGISGGRPERCRLRPVRHQRRARPHLPGEPASRGRPGHALFDGDRGRRPVRARGHAGRRDSRQPVARGRLAGQAGRCRRAELLRRGFRQPAWSSARTPFACARSCRSRASTPTGR